MSQRYKFLNTPAPQVVTGGVASAALGCSEIYVQATADCFILVSADGAIPTGGTDGHFMPGGSALPLSGINAAHKIACNTGTLYVSAIG